jgi:hypothetical protein
MLDCESGSTVLLLSSRGAFSPEPSIDPVVMATATVTRLQTIVFWEMAANESAVLTTGVLQAGTKENVIPDEANMQNRSSTIRPLRVSILSRRPVPRPGMYALRSGSTPAAISKTITAPLARF